MSPLRIRLYDEAKAFVDSLPKKRQKQVTRKMLALATDEASVQTKALVGFHPLRRLRSGDYRIVYFVEKEILHILFIDNRNDDKVYRTVLRKLK